MDANSQELAKEVAKEATKLSIEAAKELLGKLVNSSLEEVGELLADNVKYYRFKNQIKILKKAQQLIDKENIKPQNIPLKTLYPILEAGSLEEDEDMSDRWAKLLATAANPLSPIVVRPSFPEILKELSPQEATILEKIFDMVTTIPIPPIEWANRGATGESLKKVLKLSEDEFEIAIDNLYRLQLCSPPSTQLEFVDNKHHRFQLQMKDIICLTHLGFAFVSCCKKQN
jgi:mRNA-degrading endonuclease RelE of RelBE toxin-antitoxin system